MKLLAAVYLFVLFLVASLTELHDAKWKKSNNSRVLVEHCGVFYLTAGVCGAQWVTTNKGSVTEQALFTVTGMDGSIKKKTRLDLP